MRQPDRHPLLSFLAACLAGLPTPLRSPAALALAAGFLAGLVTGALMGWPWRGVVASGLLGTVLTWAALREAELRQVQSVLRAMPCHALVVGPDRRPLWQSGSGLGFAAIHGPGREEERLRTAYWHLPIHAREAEVNAGLTAHLRADGTPSEAQDAQGRWFELRHSRLPCGQTVCFSTDITEAKRREQSLAGSEARLRALLERAPVGIWELDAQGRTRFANARLRRLFLGEVPPALWAAGLPRLTPGEETEVALPLPGGRELPVLLSAAPWTTPERDGPGEGVGHILSLLDLSALKAAQARVAHLTDHDALTGLSNRAAFQAGLGAMAADPRPMPRWPNSPTSSPPAACDPARNFCCGWTRGRIHACSRSKSAPARATASRWSAAAMAGTPRKHACPSTRIWPRWKRS